jgi:hypothetical protein
VWIIKPWLRLVRSFLPPRDERLGRFWTSGTARNAITLNHMSSFVSSSLKCPLSKKFKIGYNMQITQNKDDE